MMTELEEELLNKCHAFKEECDKLKSENSELRARLAVYEDGMPNCFCLHLTANELDGLGVYEHEAKWLRRIASANEVPNGV